MEQMITCFRDMTFASASPFQVYSRGSKHTSTLHVASQGRISPKALWLKYRIRTGSPLWIRTNTYQGHQSSRKHLHIKGQADFSLEVKIWKPLQYFSHRSGIQLQDLGNKRLKIHHSIQHVPHASAPGQLCRHELLPLLHPWEAQKTGSQRILHDDGVGTTLLSCSRSNSIRGQVTCTCNHPRSSKFLSRIERVG